MKQAPHLIRQVLQRGVTVELGEHFSCVLWTSLGNNDVVYVLVFDFIGLRRRTRRRRRM